MTGRMNRSNSWLTVFVDTVCRMLDLPSPSEPVLPVWTPRAEAPQSPDGFRADNQLPADRWMNDAEDGVGGSVFVPIGMRHRSPTMS
jgi:hypothetical protein